MAYVRTVKFIYYTVCMTHYDDGGRTDPERFDFESWIYKADQRSIEQKTIEFDGIKARLEECVGDKSRGIWKLRFMKLRDTNIPSIVKEEEEAKPIELEEDEYIGEDLLIIYDRSNQVMMMQCNRFALGRGKLEKYLNRVWNVKDDCIILCPISKTIDAKKLKKKQYKRLLLRFENLHPIEKNHRPFSQIVNSYYEMGGITGEVIISLGRGRRKSGLNQEKVPQMLEDIYGNQDILSDAALKVKDDDDDSVDIINLFDKKNEKKGEYIPTHEDILKENGYLGKEEFCKCQDSPGTTTGFEDDFGYWDVCLKCGKRIEDGFHYYNHYDGEDHDDIDIW